MLKGESVFMFSMQKHLTWRRGLTAPEPPRQTQPVWSCPSSSSGVRVVKAGQVQAALAVGLPPAPARQVWSPMTGREVSVTLCNFIILSWVTGCEVQNYLANGSVGAAVCTLPGWSRMSGECFLWSSVLLRAKKGLNLNKSCICKVSGWHG